MVRSDVVFDESKARSYKNEPACLKELYSFIALAAAKKENNQSISAGILRKST
jgi:hypothetical protein